MHMYLEKQMFWKLLSHVFVPSSGLEENNIKGAFYPVAPLAPLYPIYVSWSPPMFKTWLRPWVLPQRQVVVPLKVQFL